MRLKRSNVKCPGLQVVVLPSRQMHPGESALPCRWQSRKIPNGSQSGELMRISNLSDGTDFRFSPGRGAVNGDQDCISRTSLIRQESPSVCRDRSRFLFIELKGTENGIAVRPICYVP